MHIMFVLPGISKAPIGGYKIIYEYANRFSERSYDVSILYMCSETLKKYNFPETIRRRIVILLVKIFPRWYKLNSKIKKIGVFDWSNNEIPNADVVFAVPRSSARLVANLSPEKGKKFYFIQGYENWGNSDEGELHKTYCLGMKNIVISSWLKRIVDRISQKETICIPNGIDFNDFYIEKSIEERNPYSIAMLYHTNEIKGTKYGLEVLCQLKKKYPELKAHLFGTPSRPKGLPKWIEYTRKANVDKLRSIYNNAAIFICPTIYEGFGLTGAESMACGCALVSTNYDAVYEYAVDGRNALLSPIKDVDAMVCNIEQLIENDEYRNRIATQGNQDIKKLSWDLAVEKMLRVIHEEVKEG